MKVAMIGMVGALILAASLSARKVPGISIPTNEIFMGEITDSLCADGHHVDAIKLEKSCALACVKYEGAEFVLYNTGTNHTYKLDDQQQPIAYAGEEVVVIGRYDKASNAIHVISIKPMITDASL
jgi:hypothetical protein